jgi:predicted transglutaminase-like cysteine proteinase
MEGVMQKNNPSIAWKLTRSILGLTWFSLSVATAAAAPSQSALKYEALDLRPWASLEGIWGAEHPNVIDIPLGSYAPYLEHLMSPTSDSPNGAVDGKNWSGPSMIDPIQTSAISSGVFGSYAIPMRNFPVSGRWAAVFGDIRNCATSGKCAEDSPAFSRIVGSVAGRPFLRKLAGVNREINQLIRYRRDQATYGRRDFWASPLETLFHGAGDCEDFAILKMSALLEAGIPASSMSLVVLQSRSKGAFHAVLSVNTSNGAFILDNVTDTVLRDADISDYLPLYSLSTNRAWIHGLKSGGAQVAAGPMSFSSIAPGEGPDLSDIGLRR